MRQPLMGGERANVGRQPSQAEVSGGGGWILAARVGWIVLTLLLLALNVAMLPRFAEVLRTPCEPGIHCFYLRPNLYDQRVFWQFGLSVGFLANYQGALNVAVELVYLALATLLFWRRSADRMALFCAFTLVIFGGAAYTSILQDTLAVQSALGYWLLGILYVLGQTCFITFFLLFPNGRLVPRWSGWFIAVIAIYWVYDYFGNHIYRQSFDWSTIVFFVSVLIPVGAQIYRYRRVSTTIERQQTKWVVFGFAICMIGFVLVVAVGHLLLPKELLQSGVMTTFVAQNVFTGLMLLIPVSIAIAILRSHLYDIDVLINRTLVYGTLTVILACVYVGGVVGVQSIVNTVARAPAGKTSPVLIVVTTLLIAALFQPLRRQIQRVIDRRFYRRKYDVEKTLAAFGATLRQEIDLGDLRDHLLAAVQKTMEPASLSLWLRTPTDQH